MGFKGSGNRREGAYCIPPSSLRSISQYVAELLPFIWKAVIGINRALCMYRPLHSDYTAPRIVLILSPVGSFHFQHERICSSYSYSFMYDLFLKIFKARTRSYVYIYGINEIHSICCYSFNATQKNLIMSQISYHFTTRIIFRLCLLRKGYLNSNQSFNMYYRHNTYIKCFAFHHQINKKNLLRK